MTQRTLYADDCLQVLQDPVALPTGSVDLIYLDPPFNSKSIYNLPFDGKYKTVKPVEAFKDTWTWGDPEDAYLNQLKHGPKTRNIADLVTVAQSLSPYAQTSLPAYLVNMAMRLIAMHRVLKPTGSIYLHCDPTASHYLKVMMDAIFGQENFRNEIVWKRASGKGLNPQTYVRNCDRLLFYTNGAKHVWNQQYEPFDESYGEDWREDERGKWEPENLTGGKAGGPEAYAPFKGVLPAPGRAWAPPTRDKFPPDIPLPSNYESLNPLEKCEALDAVGLIYWPKKEDGKPRYKKYLSTLKGLYASDLIYDIPPIGAHADERLGYPTQKPMALLKRIIEASSNKGDVILDPYCGCGTTIHAAESLGRQWIGIDISAFSVGLVRERLLTNFPGKRLKIETHGTPYDVTSAKTLARDDPFEFEKWVCGAIGAHGMFHDPGTKGRDGGVDGVIEFGLYQVDGAPVRKEHAIIQVKGGKVSPDHVKALSQTVEDFKGRAGIFVCFKEHLATVEQNRKRGTYADLTGTYPLIQGFSIEQLLNEEKPKLPPLVFRKDASLKQKKLGPLFDTQPS